MSTQAVHEGDIGVDFILTINDQDANPVDLTLQTTLQILFKKPISKDVLTKTATIVNSPGTDGKIRYISIANDLDESGTWIMQARVVFPTPQDFHSNMEKFEVEENLV